jgi:tRNA U38,U39,U40 pseudouridine synthase TruA
MGKFNNGFQVQQVGLDRPKESWRQFVPQVGDSVGSFESVGAGRADAGVHARGQALHFDLRMEESYKLETSFRIRTIWNEP